jgi:aminopeptidase N
VKSRKPFVPFAPGDTVARREEGELNVVESSVDKPVQFTVAHAGKYAIAEQKFEKLTVRVATYAGSNEAAAKGLATLANQIIQYYEPFLGPFPFRELNIIEIPELGFGQAPPGTIFITAEAFKPGLGTLNRAYSKGINQRFAHEIAHQYWGIVIKMGSWQEQWLTESFAEYVSSLVEKELKGQSGYNALVDIWRSDGKLASGLAPIALANRIESFDEVAAMSRTRLLYGKGAYLLAVIHKTVGDQKFLSLLRNLQGRFAWRFLTTKDVVETLSKIDGNDWQPFFDRYFWGQEMPAMPR